MSYKIPVYAEDPRENYQARAVARVTYNTNLNTWESSKWLYPGYGLHGGITKLRKAIEDKQFVFIYGPNHSYLVSDDEALSLILESGKEELLSLYFPEYQDPEEEVI